MKIKGFCGPSYVSQSPFALRERSMNWYPVRIRVENQKGFDWLLYPTPGLETFATASESPGRGLFAENGQCFVVIGQTVYEVFDTGILIARGTCQVDPTPTTGISNGDGGGQFFFTSGNRGDLLDLTTNVYTQGVVTGVTMGDMINGRFLALDASTSTLKASNRLDGLTWDPTMIAQRSAASDKWRAMKVRTTSIWLFGDVTSDVWYDAGTFPFPYAPIPGVRILYGIAAAFSAQNTIRGLMWLGQNKDGVGQVILAQGYAAAPVSNEAVDHAIAAYKRDSRIDDAVAFTYQDEGSEFYELNFPTAGATWVFDLTNGQWHERGHWSTRDSEYFAWGPQYHASVFGKHLVADFRSGTVHRMGLDVFQDALGDPLRRMRLAPLAFAGRARVDIPPLELLFEPGVGLSAGQGSDPAVMLRMSGTAGKTWGNQRTRYAGKLGQYTRRVVYERNGQLMDPAAEVVVTDPVPWRLLGASFLDDEAA